MEKFNYKAKGPGGQIVKGQVEATTAQAAAKLVREKGFVVLSIQSATASPLYLIRNLRKRIRKKDVTPFPRQLATMINAGLPITEGLSILRVQTKSTFQPVITRILADVEGGESLSGAISRYPQVFSPTY